MFIRLGSLEKVSVLQGFKREAALSSEWKDIVSGKVSLRDTDAFDYDTDNFLYFRCRAVSPGPNGNGDFFPKEELKLSFRSFIGKPFCIEHQSDTIDKARGVILDAELHEDGDDLYVECLVAVDKVSYPDIARNLELGILNSVSMGCIAEEAECSVCHNVAHNTEELCVHMQKNGCKGGNDPKTGGLVYEINRGITFVELSGVSSPAFKDAKVFEVMASQLSPNIVNEFNRYAFMKITKKGDDIAKDKKSIIAVSDDIEDENMSVKGIKNYSTSKLKKLIKKVTKSELKPKTSEEIDLGDNYILKPFANLRGRTLMQLYKDNLSMNSFTDLIVGDLSEKNKIKRYKRALRIEEQEKNEPEKSDIHTKKEEVIDMGFKLRYECGEDLANSYFVGEEGDKETRVKTTDVIPEDVQEMMVSDDADVISPEESLEVIVKECGSTLEGFEKWAIMEKVKIARRRKMKEEKMKEEKMKMKKKENCKAFLDKQKDIGFKMRYECGEDLANSYFVGREEDKEIRVKTTDVIPEDIQEMMVSDSKDVMSPEESIEAIFKECGNTLEGFEKWSNMERIKIARRKKMKEEKMEEDKMKMRNRKKKASNMMDETNSSFKTEEIVDAGKTVLQGTDQIAQDIAEQKAGRVSLSGTPGRAVKDFYNKLGDSDGGTVTPGDTWAIKVASLRKSVSLIDSLQREASRKDRIITSLQERITLLEKKSSLQEKAELIDVIVAGLEFGSTEEKDKMIEDLAKMDRDKLTVMMEVKAKTASRKVSSLHKKANLDIPQVFTDNSPKSAMDRLSDILENEVPNR